MSDRTAKPDYERRLTFVVIVLLCVGIVLMGRTASWMLVPRPEISRYCQDPYDLPHRIPAARGRILDSQGLELAASTVEYEVAASPRLMSPAQQDKWIPVLADILEQEPTRVRSAFEHAETDYVLLGTHLAPAVGRQLEGLDLDALAINVSFRRVYPDAALAASVLGFVDYLGNGQYGIERYYDLELSGAEGRWYGVRDPWGKHMLVTLGGYQPAQDGVDLELTLDRNIQGMAERILQAGVKEYRADGGTLLVLEPSTGAVVAMACTPTYEPGNYGQFAAKLGLEVFINGATSAMYEPGSTFKPLTLAAGLEAHAIARDSTYDDRGEIIVGGRTIYNANQAAYGRTNMTQLLAKSLNVGAAHVANLLGPTRFFETIRRFGFAEATGIDLASEERGIMRVPGDPEWHMSDLGANSYGQGIAVTPMQMAVAYAALANEGRLMRPYVVSRMVNRDETVWTREPRFVRQVVSPRTAWEISDIMADAVEVGMEKAVIPGYRLAGKSGTSGIPTRSGYDNQDTIASFIGYGPVEDPRFVILVKIDRPREAKWGLEVAAPLFKEMAQALIDYWAIKPRMTVAQQ